MRTVEEHRLRHETRCVWSVITHRLSLIGANRASSASDLFLPFPARGFVVPPQHLPSSPE